MWKNLSMASFYQPIKINCSSQNFWPTNERLYVKSFEYQYNIQSPQLLADGRCTPIHNICKISKCEALSFVNFFLNLSKE